jgi:adenylyltransferase/sulfurtransferase
VALPQIGADGQARISRGTVLLVGAGGIGNTVAAQLAASGIEELLVADFDRIDETNLSRQFLFGPDDVGEHKVNVLLQRLGDINPDVRVTPIPSRLDKDNLAQFVERADIVVDGSDNFQTRFAVVDACIAAGKPLVTGSAIRLEGQVAVFGPDYKTSPCYRCLYTEADESLDSCAGNGVLGPVPGVVGALVAVEVLKLLAGVPVERGQLTLYDAMDSTFRTIAIRQRKDCTTCG